MPRARLAAGVNIPADADARSLLHPDLAAWFTSRFASVSPSQRMAWPALSAGENVLLIAPTGTGKTLAAFAPVLSRLHARPAADPPAGVSVIYLTPLRSLGNDMVKNLTEPVDVLNAGRLERGLARIELAIRSGDTLATERARLRRRPPDVLITTPESLAILLTTGFAEHLVGVQAVIVDELHSLVENKRGVDCCLTLRRLEHHCAVHGQTLPQMIGLSATLRPAELAGRLLAGPRPVRVLEPPSERPVHLAIHTPLVDRPYPRSGYSAAWLVEDLAGIITRHRTTLIFANTRSSTEWLCYLLREHFARQAEGSSADRSDAAAAGGPKGNSIALPPPRTSGSARRGAAPPLMLDPVSAARRRWPRRTRALPAAEDGPAPVAQPSPPVADLPAARPGEPVRPEQIEAHHSSLDRGVRLSAEDMLKQGRLRAVISSSSLELGIDIGSVDCVVMLSTPKGVGRCLQRVGRSGHALGLEPSGIFLATNINDLVECCVTATLARRAEVEPIEPVRAPLDVLAQQLVGIAATGPWPADEIFDLVRRCPAYADLPRSSFDSVLLYLAQGGRVLERYPEFRKIHWDRSAGTIGPLGAADGGGGGGGRPGLGRTARTYVLNVGTITGDTTATLYHGSRVLGTVEESFLARLEQAQPFIFAGRAYVLQSWRGLRARVRAATSAKLVVPRWNAARMPLSTGIAAGVAALRDRIGRHLGHDQAGGPLQAMLCDDYALSPANARAVADMHTLQARLSCVPRVDQFLIERFSSRSRDVSCFFHTLAGRRANELLARVAALRLGRLVGGNALLSLDDYGFMLRLRPDQPMDLPVARALLDPAGFREDALAVLEQSPMLLKIFRETAQTALLVQENYGSAAKSHRQMHYSAEIILDVLREHEPDHPILNETRRTILEQEMDLPRAQAFLSSLPQREWVLNDVPAVTPFSFGLMATGFSENMTMESRDVLFDRAFAELAADAHAAVEAMNAAPPRAASAPPASVAQAATARPRRARPPTGSARTDRPSAG